MHRGTHGWKVWWARSGRPQRRECQKSAREIPIRPSFLELSPSIPYYRDLWGKIMRVSVTWTGLNFSSQIDRCIKLWHVNPRNSAQITREDKPLFSSSRIHRSRVLSVQWISYDTLISHNPSAILRDEPNDIENKKTHLVPGEIVVWRWLGLDRFFPPLYDNLRAEGQTQSVLRGCASVSDPGLDAYPTSLTNHCSSGLPGEW